MPIFSKFLSCLFLVSFLVACNPSAENSPNVLGTSTDLVTGGENDPTDPIIVGDRIVTTPVESTEVLANPFKGYVSYLDGAPSSTAIPMSLVYDDFTWRQLEPTKGNFNWSGVESGWAAQVALGRKIGIRFKLADPWISPANGVPDWLINAGVTMRSYSIDGGGGNAPDWDNETLLVEHARVLKALGDRYNNDPRVAFVDIGSYGIWGEWHVWQNEHLAATSASKQRILNDYFTNFPNKKLVIAFDDANATDYVTSHGQGVRNDCLGEAASNDYYIEAMNAISALIVTDVYKTGVITGEFCGGSAGALAGLNNRFALNLAFIQQTHWSWIGPAGGELASQTSANAKQMYKTLGYHFVAKEVVHEEFAPAGGHMDLSVKMQNQASAPFYYPWPVEITLQNESGQIVYTKVLSMTEADVRKWIPGTSNFNITVPLAANLAAGAYKVGIAILDPATNKPGVRLGNTGRDTNGRYYFSTLTIQ